MRPCPGGCPLRGTGGHKEKASSISAEGFIKKAATYSPTLRCSTIGALGLNFSVRDGKRWNPEAKTTQVFRSIHN